MNYRFTAIAACVFAFLSLPLEWWTLQGNSGIFAESCNVYLYMIISKQSFSNFFSAGMISSIYNFPTLEGLAALILMTIGGIIAVVSSFRVEQRMFWLTSGLCMMLAIALFSGRLLSSGLARGLIPYPNFGVLFALFATALVFYGYLKLRKESIMQATAETTV
jgi:hypothetical protein